ncbi:hypothetical protein GCM10007415_34680 [Parapedobacter pyrenivorans]|uniref:Cyclic nucleotide-binding domain-containing protein n=1 Tax=Parapedobacter pyrenivorans TaxID=1305674 RepID=A0A917MDE8_9SPHI|nr:Crp/Fnr family transcriptional regulator [Parapedobacter pyrenivorans]GGG96541.1 hypothetical protein GCM10007415_34680 [Parapedobacter pyrenivorans]
MHNAINFPHQLTNMERFFTYSRQWVAMEEKARGYLLNHSQIRSYRAGTDFTTAGDARPFWCFVLSGLVVGVEHLASGRQIYNWLVRPGEYFTGTMHLFTGRPHTASIHFLRDTQLLLIPAAIMQYAQQHFLSISELLHVLKQRRMQRQEELLLLVLKPTNSRYAVFRIHMHELFALLDEKEQIAYLHMSRSQYFTAKAAFNKLP